MQLDLEKGINMSNEQWQFQLKSILRQLERAVSRKDEEEKEKEIKEIIEDLKDALKKP